MMEIQPLETSLKDASLLPTQIKDQSINYILVAHQADYLLPDEHAF
jgi:hypothetical protein